MHKSTISDIDPSKLLSNYKIDDERFRDFILSPLTYINDKDEVLICKNCYSKLCERSKVRNTTRDTLPPKESIINGYVIGNPPLELSELSDVELTLTSRVQIFCQTWVFFRWMPSAY